MPTDFFRSLLGEWWPLLADGGTLEIVVPDVGASIKRYARGEYSLDHIIPQIFGNYRSGDAEPRRHRYAYDSARRLETLSCLPWSSLSWLDFGNPPAEIREFAGRQIVLADWQIGVVLVK